MNGTISILNRMHWPYAEEAAKQHGVTVRRAGWTKWLLWDAGLWWVLGDGDARVARATDVTADDLLAWDWTTQAATCESTGADEAPDMAALLTVTPYHALARVVDPLGRQCAVGASSGQVMSTAERAAAPVLAMKDGRPVLPSLRPAIVLPAAQPVEWRPGRPRLTGASPQGPTTPPPVSLTFVASSNLSTFLAPEGFCIDSATISSSPDGGETTVSLVSVTLSGGEPGDYDVEIGIASGPSTIGTVIWSGTMTSGQTITFWPRPDETFTFPWDSTKTILGQASLDEEIVDSYQIVLTMPGMCEPDPYP